MRSMEQSHPTWRSLRRTTVPSAHSLPIRRTLSWTSLATSRHRRGGLGAKALMLRLVARGGAPKGLGFVPRQFASRHGHAKQPERPPLHLLTTGRNGRSSARCHRKRIGRAEGCPGLRRELQISSKFFGINQGESRERDLKNGRQLSLSYLFSYTWRRERDSDPLRVLKAWRLLILRSAKSSKSIRTSASLHLITPKNRTPLRAAPECARAGWGNCGERVTLAM